MELLMARNNVMMAIEPVGMVAAHDVDLKLVAMEYLMRGKLVMMGIH